MNKERCFSFHTGSPTAHPVATQHFLRSLLTALPVFPAVSPLTPERPSSSPFLAPGAGRRLGRGAWDPSRDTEAPPRPCSHSWGLSHYIQVPSPSSGKTNRRVRPTSGAGEMSAKMPLEGEWGVSSQPSQLPSTNPVSAPPGSGPALGLHACPGAELGRQKLMTNQATAPHTRLTPQEMNKI